MFAGADLTKSRTIRFIDIISLVLASIFADTVFFGIYFPSDSSCEVLKEKVRQIVSQSFTVLFVYNYHNIIL